MAKLASGIRQDSSLLNLKAMDMKSIRPEIINLLVNDERIIAAFKTIRDQVIITTKRIFVVNVQGVTGKKTAYFSYPFSKVQYFGIETAGLLDIDSELILTFSDGTVLQLDFRDSVDIKQINQVIAHYIL